MSNFTWTEALRIGVDAMDRDHEKIIDLMNELASANDRGATFTELDKAFTALATFTRKHFHDEEAHMESVGFEGLNTHHVIHRRLLDELDGHYSAFKLTRELDEGVFKFLKFWLKSHICGIDRKYAAVS